MHWSTALEGTFSLIIRDRINSCERNGEEQYPSHSEFNCDASKINHTYCAKNLRLNDKGVSTLN